MSSNLIKESDDTVIKRDERNLKNAKPILAPILSVSMLVMVAMVVMIIIKLIVGDYKTVVICALVFMLLGAYGMYCDTLNWIYNVEYRLGNDKFEYRYNLDANLLPVSNSKVVVTINHLKDYKVVGNKIIVHGEIIKKAPMQKPKEYKKFKLANVPDKTEVICSYFDRIKS